MADTPEIQARLDMADVADAVKAAVTEYAPAAMEEAIKPFMERSTAGLEKYADALTELERKKAELDTPPREKGCTFTRYARLLALGKGDWARGLYEAKQRSNWGADDSVVKSVEKALTASDPGGAGTIIPPGVSAEFIELLRNMAVVRSVARVIPMPFGSLSLRKQTAAATAAYTAESTNTSSSQQTVGSVELSFKKLVTVTPISNSLLRFAGGEADRMVRDDLVQTMAIREDLAFIQGDGDENTPIGILNRVASANKFDDTGTTAATQMTDYAKAIRLVETANVPLTTESGYWFFHPQPFWGMKATAGGAGDVWPFQNMVASDRVYGYAVKRTVQVGTDKIYFVHGPSLLIGDSMGVELTAHDGGAYYDGSSVVSGVSRDETVIRAVSEHDFNMRHDLAASVIETVTVA